MFKITMMIAGCVWKAKKKFIMQMCVLPTVAHSSNRHLLREGGREGGEEGGREAGRDRGRARGVLDTHGI